MAFFQSPPVLSSSYEDDAFFRAWMQRHLPGDAHAAIVPELREMAEWIWLPPEYSPENTIILPMEAKCAVETSAKPRASTKAKSPARSADDMLGELGSL